MMNLIGIFFHGDHSHSHGGEGFNLLELLGGLAPGMIGFVIIALVAYKLISVNGSSNGVSTQAIISKEKNLVQIIFAALIGVTPGCGGAIAVAALYKEKKVTFGALVAAFTTTMGEGTFLLLVSHGGEHLAELFFIILISLVVGIAAGIAIDFYKIAPKVEYREPKPEKTFDNEAYYNIINIIFPIVLVILAIVLMPYSIGVLFDFHAEGFIEIVQEMVSPTIVVLLVVYHIILKAVGNIKSRFDSKQVNAVIEAFKEIAFITTYIVIGFIIAELVMGQLAGEHGYENLIHDYGTIVILIAVLIGLTPGCGGFLVIGAIYIEGGLPFSALIGAAIATNGDAMFALVAKDKKAILIVTLITGILGLMVGLLVHPFHLFT